MTGSIRNFEKLNFTPKSSVFCFSQGQTSKYDRLAQSCTASLLKNLLCQCNRDLVMFDLVKNCTILDLMGKGAKCICK